VLLHVPFMCPHMCRRWIRKTSTSHGTAPQVQDVFLCVCVLQAVVARSQTQNASKKSCKVSVLVFFLSKVGIWVREYTEVWEFCFSLAKYFLCAKSVSESVYNDVWELLAGAGCIPWLQVLYVPFFVRIWVPFDVLTSPSFSTPRTLKSESLHPKP